LNKFNRSYGYIEIKINIFINHANESIYWIVYAQIRELILLFQGDIGNGRIFEQSIIIFELLLNLLIAGEIGEANYKLTICCTYP
jgi:hypothetical protein